MIFEEDWYKNQIHEEVKKKAREWLKRKIEEKRGIIRSEDTIM